VDIAIVEVGMGGRLDATNVVQPEVSIITSIGLDHCAELGDTVEKIAAEKAGIIKPGRPVVIGRMPAAAEEVIRTVAETNGAAVHSVREQFGETPGRYPLTNLEGDYQRWNAATAVLAARLLPAGLRPDDGAMVRGLASVNWPGRWQRLEVAGRTVVLDASHNPEGAEMLEQSLQRLVAKTSRQPIIVAGALGEFRARALLDAVLPHARELHLVTPRQSRATPAETMRRLVPAASRVPVQVDDLADIFPDAATCTLGAPGDTVVVTGSIYLLGEVLERLEPGRGSGEGRLQDF
jgi:dihydrofolate synthase/folylpolyglutamate synthase